MDFKENDLFQENEQNEQILTNFQERVLYRSVSFIEKSYILRKLANLSDLTQRNYRFQWNFKRQPSTVCCTSIIKLPHFNEIKDIKEIRDFLPDFKRESHTVWCTNIIKSTDFNEIKDINRFQ